MSPSLPDRKSIAISVIALFLFSFLCLGLALYVLMKTSQDRQRLSLIQDEKRVLQDKITRLEGSIHKLKAEFQENLDLLKTHQQQLNASRKARLLYEKEKLKELERKNQRALLVKTAQEEVQSLIPEKLGSVFLKNGEIVIRLSNQVLFRSAESEIREEGKTVLRGINELFLSSLKNYYIRVEGHTDNVPISKSLKWKFPSNWNLSAARASSAVQFFIEEGTLDPTRITAVGRADTFPIASNDTDQGKALNRRIDIIIDITKTFSSSSSSPSLSPTAPAVSSSPVN